VTRPSLGTIEWAGCRSAVVQALPAVGAMVPAVGAMAGNDEGNEDVQQFAEMHKEVEKEDRGKYRFVGRRFVRRRAAAMA
jgi:hypothetical protein